MKKFKLRKLIREEIQQILYEGTKPVTDAIIKKHINTFSVSDDPYDVAVKIGKKYNWNQREIEKAEKIIRNKYIK